MWRTTQNFQLLVTLPREEQCSSQVTGDLQRRGDAKCPTRSTLYRKKKTQKNTKVLRVVVFGWWQRRDPLAGSPRTRLRPFPTLPGGSPYPMTGSLRDTKNQSSCLNLEQLWRVGHSSSRASHRPQWMNPSLTPSWALTLRDYPINLYHISTSEFVRIQKDPPPTPSPTWGSENATTSTLLKSH